MTIPLMGGEMLNEDLNVFLRSKKVLQVEQHLVAQVQGAVWTFVIRYVEDHSPIQKNKEKIDYRLVLTEAAFGRYSRRRLVQRCAALPPRLPFRHHAVVPLLQFGLPPGLFSPPVTVGMHFVPSL